MGETVRVTQSLKPASIKLLQYVYLVLAISVIIFLTQTNNLGSSFFILISRNLLIGAAIFLIVCYLIIFFSLFLYRKNSITIAGIVNIIALVIIIFINLVGTLILTRNWGRIREFEGLGGIGYIFLPGILFIIYGISIALTVVGILGLIVINNVKRLG